MLVRLDMEEIEGLLLDVGELGDDWKNTLGLIRDVHLVEDDGGEIGEQCAEAVGGKTVGAVSGGGLASGGVRRLRGFHRGLAGGFCTVGVIVPSVREQHRRACPAHVPLHVEGQHAEEHIRAHAVFLVDVQGTDIEIGLGLAEGAFHRGEILVGFDGGVGRDRRGRQAGAHAIHTVPPRFGGDTLLPALPHERRVGNGDREVFPDLPAVDVASDGPVEDGDAFPAPGPDRGRDLFERLFRGGQQILPFAGPFLLQSWVETDHEPLVGKGVMRHLRSYHHGIRNQFLGLEGRRMIVGRFEQLADVRGGESRDPVDHRRLEILPDAAGGDHAAIAHKRHPGETEALADFLHLCRQCGGIGGIPFEPLDRDRTAVRRGSLWHREVRTQCASCLSCHPGCSRTGPADNRTLRQCSTRRRRATPSCRPADAVSLGSSRSFRSRPDVF